jgi:hypothetical protein
MNWKLPSKRDCVPGRFFNGSAQFYVTWGTLPSIRRSKKTFDLEGAILEQALKKCLSDRETALKDLADAAKRVDKAAFGRQSDFGQAHQALLKALDRAADFIRN